MSRITPAVLLAAAFLAACGGSAGSRSGGDEAGVDQPSGTPPAAGMCVDAPEEIEDCVDTIIEDDTASDEPPDDAFDHDEVILEAQSLIGEAEEDVIEWWPQVWIGRRGDEEMMLTQDHVPGRMTVAVEDDGTGTYRVVEVVVETTEGSETVLPTF